MSIYSQIRHKAVLLLQSKQGCYITEVYELASHFSDEISLQQFIQRVYNKRIADLLWENRTQLKSDLRKRWFASRQVKANELVYRLWADKEELARLDGKVNETQESGEDPLLKVLNPQDIWSDESDPVQ